MAISDDNAVAARSIVQDVLGRLTSVNSVLITVSSALKRDDIEHNPDYAVCLECCAIPSLCEAISKLDELQGKT